MTLKNGPIFLTPGALTLLGRGGGGKGLVTNYGEGWLQNARGHGMWSFSPTEGGGGRGPEKVLAMLKGVGGGGTTNFGVVFFTW